MQFVINVDKAFRVKVIPKPAELPKEEPQKTTAGSTVWIWILAVLVVIIIAWMIWKKKNNN